MCKQNITIFKPGGQEWSEKHRTFGHYTEVPCGKCALCKYFKTQDYAVRCLCEAEMHQYSSFITLTYDPAFLPEDGSLSKKHVSDFLKRLRRQIEYHYNQTGIRFFASGEYGEKTSRPHYHILLFGFKFDDLKFHRHTYAHGKSYSVYRSEFLEKSWQYGFSEIGTVERASAFYTAKYIRKKMSGDLAETHYQGKTPEFQLASKKPGIGYPYYEKNKNWLFKEGMVFFSNRHYMVPLYFQKKLKEQDPEAYAEWEKNKPLVIERLRNTRGAIESDYDNDETTVDTDDD